MVPYATQSPLHQAATTGTGCVILGSQIASNEAGFLVPLSLPLLAPKSLEATCFRKPRFNMAQLPSDFKNLRSREQFRAF